MDLEIRKSAIARYLKEESPKSIYTDLNRSKEWFFKWLRRYKSGDPDWYKDKSKAPKRRPNQIHETEEQRIISVRKHLESQKFAQTGTSAIKWELTKSGFTFPSDSTINRVLKREGLVKKNSLYPQRGRVSVFHRSTGHQQYPPGRPSRTSLHQRRRQILFIQSDGCIQPSGLYRGPAHQGGPANRLQPAEMLEGHGVA